MIRISESVVALLDLLQFRLGVSIEVLDTSLRPAQPALQGEFAGAVDEPGVRAQCVAVLRSGESRVEGGARCRSRSTRCGWTARSAAWCW
jgi:hypothetical protein